jgi:uncharacterized protein (TIGR00369 family)
MHDVDPAAAPPPSPEGVAGWRTPIRSSHPEAAPWRTPVRGGHPDASLAARPGVEFLRAMLAGETPAPPLSHLTGMRPVQLSADCAQFTMPVSPWLCGEDGRVPLGVLAIPADAAMACAIIAALPGQTAITTAELALRQLRPAPQEGMLVTTAAVVESARPGPPVAIAEVTVADEAGTLIARGGSLCVVLPFSPQDGDDDAWTGHDAADLDGPDPWQWPAADAGLSRLTGLTARAVAPGEAAFALPATPWLCAPPPGRVQGGVVAMLAGAAIEATMQTAAPADSRFVPLELKLNYLRPLASDGREAIAHATLVHGGRRTAVARAEVVDADGRAVAVASGSAVAQPIGAASESATAPPVEP